MEEIINKEFEEYQKELEIRNKKLKFVVEFSADEKLDKIINEIKYKDIKLYETN